MISTFPSSHRSTYRTKAFEWHLSTRTPVTCEPIYQISYFCDIFMLFNWGRIKVGWHLKSLSSTTATLLEVNRHCAHRLLYRRSDGGSTARDPPSQLRSPADLVTHSDPAQATAAFQRTISILALPILFSMCNMQVFDSQVPPIAETSHASQSLFFRLCILRPLTYSTFHSPVLLAASFRWHLSRLHVFI